MISPRHRIAVIISLLWFSLMAHLSASRAQNPASIDVFLLRNRDTGQVRVSFTNAVTGLSAVAIVDNLASERDVLEEFKLAANGVIFRSPGDGLLRLITPTGNIVNINFIPQRTDSLLGIEWVISEDGRTIAWAELFFQGTIWQANLYVSRLDGSDFRALPPLPEKPPTANTRVAMIAVSNDGSRIFFDIEHPTAPRRPTDYFVTYQQIWVYVEAQRSYRPLLPDGATSCPCSARVVNDGGRLIELVSPILGNGFAVRVWNLENNRSRTISAVDTIYNQGGALLSNQSGNLILYTLGSVEGATPGEPPSFALGIVDMLAGQQRIISVPAGQRMAAMAFTNRDREAIIVDTLENKTYKFDIETNTLDPVADQVWLGSLTR